MAHVVMQAAEFGTLEAARACELELRALMNDWVRFEEDDPDPWSTERVPPPLLAFGAKHGVTWPRDETSRFLLKGAFEDAVELLRVGRMVFFWGGGFELGGPTLRAVLTRLGAVRAGDACHLQIAHDDPEARVAELAEFLDAEDFEEQYEVVDVPPEGSFFSLTVRGPEGSRCLAFDDSGVQDWAFVALLPQLEGEDPTMG